MKRSNVYMQRLPDKIHLFAEMAQKTDAGNDSQTDRIQKAENRNNVADVKLIRGKRK